MNHQNGEQVDHTTKVMRMFGTQLHDLRENCGFEITTLPSKGEGAGSIHLKHPLLHLEYTIARSQQGVSFPETAVQALQHIANEYHASVETQNALVDQWNEQGWNMVTNRRDYDPSSAVDGNERHERMERGREGYISFVYEGNDPAAKGAHFSVPSHCEYAIDVCDTQLVKQRMAEILPPQSVITEAEHHGSGKPLAVPFVERHNEAKDAGLRFS